MVATMATGREQYLNRERNPASRTTSVPITWQCAPSHRTKKCLKLKIDWRRGRSVRQTNKDRQGGNFEGLDDMEPETAICMVTGLHQTSRKASREGAPFSSVWPPFVPGLACPVCSSVHCTFLAPLTSFLSGTLLPFSTAILAGWSTVG